MTIKQLIITVLLATIICWLAWGLVIFQVDPTASGFFGFLLFYLALFFALLGTLFLLTFFFRRIFNKLDLEYRIVAASFRQSFFFALVPVIILFLQSRSLLTWWNIILLIIALSALEFFFLTYKRQI